MLEAFRTGDWYHYRMLPEQEKKIYMHIYNGLKAQQNDFTFPVETCGGVLPDQDRMVDLMLHVVWDNPELFYFDATNASYIYKKRGGFGEFRLMYTDYFPAGQLQQVHKILLLRADEILREAEEDACDYSRLYRIYRHIVKSIRYMYSIEKTNSLKNLEARTVVGPLLNHLGVCAGYTKTFKLLCDQLGIGCFYIRGQALTDKGWANHGWNAVYLDGEFYHVDITFDSSRYRATGKCSCTYFLKSDSFMERDHRWDRGHFPAMPNDWL